MFLRYLLITFSLLTVSITAASHPRLLIKFPTRSRPEQFFQTLDAYYTQISGQLPYIFVITCDADDITMNNPAIIERLEQYPHLYYYFGNSKTKIEACNKDIERHLDFDILLLASDDMIPIVKNYDLIIAKKMRHYFPKYDGIVHFNDGTFEAKLDTFPIMGKKFYNRFGYVYHPAYISFYCDNEMTEIARLLNKLVYDNRVLIKHTRPNLGETDDPLYKRNDTYMQIDKKTFETRRARFFDLKSLKTKIHGKKLLNKNK